LPAISWGAGPSISILAEAVKGRVQHARYSSHRRLLLQHEGALETFPRPERSAVPVAAGSPAPYRVAMSNLGFHFLYAVLRRSPKLRVERFFADTAPVTLESGTRLSTYGVLLCSISYEEDYINLVRMLHESGLPPLREERRGRPLVIVGGPAVSANPFPVAAIVDAVALGEGEGTLEAIAGILEESGGAGREDVLDELARVPGVFVPGRPPGTASVRRGAALRSFPRSVIVTPDTAFPMTVLVESGRGCPGTCAFCLATSLYAPFRYAPRALFEEIVSSAPMPIRRIGLVSAAVAANPDFAAIVRFLTAKGISVSFSSLRAEDLDDERSALVGAIGTSSVSIAPESGSESVRFRLGKRVSDETYFRAAARLREAGVRRFTLYMLVSSFEDRASDDKTVRFIERLKLNLRGARVEVHLNQLVPKAWTPLQFYAMPDVPELSAAQGRLERLLRGLGVGVRVKSVRSAVRQALFSTGDERVGRAIVHHVAESFSWNKALVAAGANARFPHEKKGPDSSFPWDAIEGPVRRGFLFKRFEAMKNESPFDAP
jgi:radical SAM superfamily enzyme YgiQ (UPF0313 family)